VQELLDEHSDVADRADAFTPPAFKGEIAFRALSFTYPGETQPALEKIDLTVPAGQTVGIVGATGSGKSTLAALVARFYPVPDGVLLIDGHDINRLRVSDLRQSIGFVAQETFLFSESIEDNIRFGQPEATRSEVEIASELAQLQEQVVSFPESYETMLGERGINLSGGQRQRAAIARATILDPAILILDDALSAVDTDTEERILEGLRGVMEGRTTLIIAHRISTVMSADEIIVLDRGRIVERGTHATLTAKGGLYADMHRRQLLEAQLEAVD
jgi:ATP-binding cassette subfamily B protein